MPIKVRVGQTEAVKILSSKGGGSVSTQDAVNVIGGIASVSQLSVSGVSTFTGIGTFVDDLYVGDRLYAGNTLNVTNDINIGNILYVPQAGGIDNQGFTNLYGNVSFNGTSNTFNSYGQAEFSGSTQISGNLNATGITTISNLYGDASNLTGVTVAGIDTAGTSNLNQLNVAGVSTFNDNVGIASDKSLNIGGKLSTQYESTYDIIYTNNNASQYILASDGITLQNVAGQKFIKATSTNTGLYHVGTQKLRTSTEGIEVVNNASGVLGTMTALDGIFTGNVSVAGTLTYEDVTNVDSVGIITAQSGIRISDGGLMITAGISTFGAIATFTNDVFVDGTLTAGIIDGGSF